MCTTNASTSNQEFSIDIVCDSNKTVIHNKVAARVLCVLNEQDVPAAVQMEQQLAQNPPGYALSNHHQNMTSTAGPSNTFNFNGQGSAIASQQHPVRPVNRGSIHPPGKSSLASDLVLSRLEGEFQKSRKTGAELRSLNNLINDIHNTLGDTWC